MLYVASFGPWMLALRCEVVPDRIADGGEVFFHPLFMPDYESDGANWVIRGYGGYIRWWADWGPDSVTRNIIVADPPSET